MNMNINEEFANDNNLSLISEMGIGDDAEVKKAEQQRRNEWLKEKIELRRKQQIQFIITQTNYDEMEAIQKLEEHKNDVIKVVSDYLGIGPKIDDNASKTKNQKVFSVIRDIMDSGSRNFIIQQERSKKIEELKFYIESKNKKNDSNMNEIEKNDLRIIKEKID
jgi:hypothetical protein